MTKGRIEHYNEILPQVAKQSSELERRAEEAERETLKLKKAEYMEQFVGQEFPGVISGITAWGIYVELENSVEGLVHITSLTDDYYEFSESTYELIGERNNRHYKLGQKVIILVDGVDLAQKTVDFKMVQTVGGNYGSEEER